MQARQYFLGLNVLGLLFFFVKKLLLKGESMMKYQELIALLLKNIGGKENINNVTHCLTRLRFNLQDRDKANKKLIENIEGVVTVIESAGQFQVVIGNHVGDVYKELQQEIGLSVNSIASEEGQESKGVIGTLIDIISGIFTPFVSVLMAAGMIKGLLALLVATNVLDKTSGTYMILETAGNGLFYFFPLFLGYTAAQKFKVKPFLGMAVGASLVYPTILQTIQGAEPLYSIFKGTFLESAVYADFLGIPIILMNYTSSVIPVILAVFVASKFQKLLEKVIPDVVKNLFIPFLILLVVIPMTFIVIGPISTWLSIILGKVIITLYELSPIIAGMAIGAIWPLVIMFGLHWGLIPIALNNLSVLGYDTVLTPGSAMPLAMAGAVLAILLKTNNKKVKELAIPSFLSSVFGITEPALYGLVLPRKKVFYSVLASISIAGGIMGFFQSKSYNMGATGIFAIPNYVNPETGIDKPFIGYLIAVTTAFTLAFIFTYFFSFNEEKTVNNDLMKESETEKRQTIIVASPLSGKIIPLEKIEDKAFSSGLLGKGVGIEPKIGELYAPETGVVTTFFPSHHAIGLTLDNGVEILIHVGMDTVNLKGKYFNALVNQGDRVEKGQLLLKFDITSIKSEGYNIQTPVVIANSEDYSYIEPDLLSEIKNMEKLMSIIS